MFRSTLIRLAGCALIAVIAVGQTKVITLKDGREVTGEVTRTDSGYVVKTRFATLSIADDQVVSVKDVVTPEQEYQQRLAKIDPADAQARYDLGKWAFDRGLLEAAKAELEAALKVSPSHDRARLLLRQVDASIAAAKAKSASPDASGTRTAPTQPVNGVANTDTPALIGEEDIYRIRLAELREEDKTLPIDFRNNVEGRFLESMKGKGMFADPDGVERFRRMSRVDKALMIVKEKGLNSEYAKDIRVKGDPRTLLEFRPPRGIWPIISQQCGSANCHGAEKGKGQFKLWNITGSSDKADYTNFITMDMFIKNGMQMINRERADRSLLLEYGLPEGQTRTPHPGKCPAAFTSRDNANYKRIEAWIRSLKGPQHPEYGVEYRPPFGPKFEGYGPNIQLNETPTTAPAAGDDKPLEL